MASISDFFTWLFSDRAGVLCLVVGGILVCLVIAIILESRMRKRYFNHEKSEDDFSLFDFGDDDESEE